MRTSVKCYRRKSERNGCGNSVKRQKRNTESEVKNNYKNDLPKPDDANIKKTQELYKTFSLMPQDIVKSITESIKRTTKRLFHWKSESIKETINSPVKETQIRKEIIPPSYMNENMCLVKELPLTHVSNNQDLKKYLRHQQSLQRRSESSYLPKFVSCTPEVVQHFLKLIEEDPMIHLFLKRDICKRYADKYLIAIVIVYFIRSKLDPEDFTRENFFAALYLAHDVEEDIEELKHETFPFALGSNWKKTYKYILTLRLEFFWAMDCRAAVSKRACEQIMEMEPTHWFWERERPEYHADVYGNSVNDDIDHPRGPFKSPLWCKACLERDCIESDNSYIVYSSLSSFSNSSSDCQKDKENQEDWPTNNIKDSGFESPTRVQAEDDLFAYEVFDDDFTS